MPSAPRLFDNGVEGNDQLYSPLFKNLLREKEIAHDVLCMILAMSHSWLRPACMAFSVRYFHQVHAMTSIVEHRPHK